MWVMYKIQKFGHQNNLIVSSDPNTLCKWARVTGIQPSKEHNKDHIFKLPKRSNNHNMYFKKKKNGNLVVPSKRAGGSAVEFNTGGRTSGTYLQNPKMKNKIK